LPKYDSYRKSAGPSPFAKLKAGPDLKTVKELDGYLAGINVADTEVQAELYKYLKNRPLAKLGLDAYLFNFRQDPSLMTRHFKEMKNMPLPIYRVDKDRLPNDKAEYTFMDEILMSPTADEGEFVHSSRLGKPESEGYQYAKSRDQYIKTLIHELEHRGGQFLRNWEKDNAFRYIKKDGSNPIEQDRKLEPQGRTDHGAISYYDYKHAEDNPDAVISTPPTRGVAAQSEYNPSARAAAARNRRIKRMFENDPDVRERFPSVNYKTLKTTVKALEGFKKGGVVKNKYARGGKVYSNMQSRKVRI